MVTGYQSRSLDRERLLMNAHANPDYLPAMRRLYDTVPRPHWHILGLNEDGTWKVLIGRKLTRSEADHEANEEISKEDCEFLSVHAKKCAGRFCR